MTHFEKMIKREKRELNKDRNQSIEKEYKKGKSIEEIAEKLKVDKSTVYMIIKNVREGKSYILEENES